MPLLIVISQDLTSSTRMSSMKISTSSKDRGSMSDHSGAKSVIVPNWDVAPTMPQLVSTISPKSAESVREEAKAPTRLTTRPVWSEVSVLTTSDRDGPYLKAGLNVNEL